MNARTLGLSWHILNKNVNKSDSFAECTVVFSEILKKNYPVLVRKIIELSFLKIIHLLIGTVSCAVNPFLKTITFTVSSRSTIILHPFPLPIEQF